jgi:hypothetical protein
MLTKLLGITIVDLDIADELLVIFFFYIRQMLEEI